MTNPAREALTRAVNKAIREGPPAYAEQPARPHVYNATTALQTLQAARTCDLRGWNEELSGNHKEAEELANKAAAMFLAVEAYLARLA